MVRSYSSYLHWFSTGGRRKVCGTPQHMHIVDKYIKNSSNYNVEYRDGIKSKGDKIGMPCTHSTVK